VFYRKFYPTSSYHFHWQVFATEVMVAKKGSDVEQFPWFFQCFDREV